MEHDKGLDLSLGLPGGGGSSSKSNEMGNIPLDATSNGTDRTSKILSDFRNFLNGGISQQQLQGGYFNNLPSSSTAGHASEDGNARRFRASTSSTERVVDVEGEKGSVVGDKRKNLYEEVTNQKKQETGAQNSDLHDNAGTSHISITTDDGSTADTEDVAESVSETSRLVPTVEESSKQHLDARSSSEAAKELSGKVTASLPPFSLQSTSSLNVPCSITFKDAAPAGLPSTAGDRTQAMNAGNTPMMFGYSHGQLPLLDTDRPWGMVSRPPVLHQYSGRPLSASGTNHGLSEGEHSTEDNLKTSNASVVFRGNSGTEIHKENSFPSEYPGIRPGMAADLKFGGSGSLPNLPWVSTTGPGPNGRTISGVTYRFSANQIKIVCACHGLHMPPEDFIQHASDEPPPATDGTAVATSSALASFPGTSNTATSAKS